MSVTQRILKEEKHQMKKIGMMSALLAGGAAFAADGIKMGGFVDAGWNWVKDGNSGFAMNEGAFYFGKTMGMGEVMVDMPLTLTDSPGPNFLLAGLNKAQAYITWKYDSGFNWKVGQFDYVLGFEAADSADRLMASSGIVSSLFGAVHLGTTIGYNLSDSMGFNLLFANESRANDDSKYNSGLTFNMSSDDFRFNTGFILNNDDSWIFDLNAGTKFGSIDVDFEAAFASTGVEGADMTMGYLVQANFEMNESMGLGLRGELVKVGDLSTIAFAFGPHFMMSKDLTVRADFNYTKVNTDGVDAGMGLMLSAVHKF
jgi:hypothetical protein